MQYQVVMTAEGFPSRETSFPFPMNDYSSRRSYGNSLVPQSFSARPGIAPRARRMMAAYLTLDNPVVYLWITALAIFLTAFCVYAYAAIH